MPISATSVLSSTVKEAYRNLRFANYLEIICNGNQDLLKAASAKRSEAILSLFAILIGPEKPEDFYSTALGVGIKNINFSELETAYRQAKEQADAKNNEWKKLKVKIVWPAIKKIMHKASLVPFDNNTAG